ncbi:MAG: hypothetical protein LBQ66_12785 [Planctomycetaceae bacterium]|jgi:hypothetical protein|nr:hypothetical protein [Planctomycetaceae bacterium]
MTTLNNYQTKLEQHFQLLYKKRQGSYVYLLEHPFSKEELAVLVDLVKTKLRLSWQGIECLKSVYFPILILATETGYKYRGNGTGFWKEFARQIGLSDINIKDREIISERFDFVAGRYHIAQPLNTTWATTYRHIAKPITNAILPLDIRLPLLESLEQLLQYSNFDPKNLVDQLLSLRENIPSRTKRYTDWISASPIVTPLVLALINEEENPTFLTAETLERIRHDIELDKKANSILRKIRGETAKRRLSQHTKNHEPQKRTTTLCHIFIRQENNEYIFDGQLPKTVSKTLRNDKEFVRILRADQWKPTTLNGKVKLKPGVFLRNDRFEISLNNELDISFLGEDEMPEGLSEESLAILKSLRLRFECPAVFGTVDDNLYKKRAAPKIERDEGILLCLTQKSDDIRVIDTSNSEDIEWAIAHGFIVTEKRMWKWIVPFGEVDEDSKQIIVKKNMPEVFVYDLLKNEITKYDELKENQTVHVNGEEWTIIVSENKHQPLFSAELLGEYNVNALTKRTLSLSVDSSISLQNPNYTLLLTDGSEYIASKKQLLDSLPNSIGKNKIFHEAFKEQESETKDRFWQLISGRRDLTLTLNIENIFQQEWTLEAVVLHVWWEDVNDSQPRAVSDTEEFNVVEILHKERRYSLYSDEYKLFCAVDFNGNPVAGLGTILHCPKTNNSSKILNITERNLRQEDDDVKKSSVGLRNIVTDILAFRQAQTNNFTTEMYHFITEMYRRQILDELEAIFWTITCSEQWTNKNYEFKRRLIYPFKAREHLANRIKRDLSEFNPNFDTDWSLKSLTDYFENWQKEFLKGSPYRSIWNTNIIKNVFALFLNPDEYYSQWETETLKFLLRDRQSVRAIWFLLHGFRQIETKWKGETTDD